MSSLNVVPANKVFLTMGLEKNPATSKPAFVLFCGIIADSQERAAALFQEKNPNHELMSCSSLSEMQDAVKLLTYIQEGRDQHDADFPLPVHRDAPGEIDAGAFGL